MSARLLLAVASEELRSQVSATLSELRDEIEVLGVAETSADLLLAVDSAIDLDLVLVDDQIGPMPYQSLVRDLLNRAPEVAVLVMSADHGPSMYQAAMDSGARGLLSSPPSPDELADRLPAILTWQRHLRSRTAMAPGMAFGGSDQPGRLIAFTGSKGGVGTSTVALHTALLAIASNRDHRVCLIDLDLQQRGMRHLFDVAPRRTLADLTLIADSLTGRNLDEASIVHRSGLRALMAPPQGEQAEDITGEVARHIIGVAKGHYDLIVVDAGSVVSEASAVAMEFADQLIVVTTPDVPSIRSAQDKLEMLDRLQVAKTGDATILFNKVSARNEIQPEFGARMLSTEAFRTSVPEDPKRLESAANAMAPVDLEDGPFRRAVISLGRELNLALPARDTPATLEEASRGDKPDKKAKKRRRRRGDDGQVTIEAVVGLAVAMLIAMILIQFTLLVIANVSSRTAADAAARVSARGGTYFQAKKAAEDAAPGFFKVRVREVNDTTYEATLTAPTVVPWLNQPIKARGSAAEEDD